MAARTSLEGATRDDHLAGLERGVAGLDAEAFTWLPERAHSGGGPDRKVEVARVALQVVAHLPPRWAAGGDPRKRQAAQRVVSCRRVQDQRVVAIAPHIADARGRLEDHEVEPLLLEVVAGGEAGLAGPDDDDIVGFAAHFSTPPAVVGFVDPRSLVAG